MAILLNDPHATMTSPALPSVKDFEQAAELLHGVVARTPLLPLHTYQQEREAQDILLKVETHQPVTSFKIRGIYHAVAKLSEEDRKPGLSTVSAGNTAQALAWTAQRFGVMARSIMPQGAPATKIQAVKDYGGEPVLVSREEVFAFLREHRWEDEPYAFVHPWTNRDVMIGHGTMALEILAQAPDFDTIFVPVGGGGLLGGVGSAVRALKPDVRIIAVEPSGCPALHESLKQGKPAKVDCQTICDGVAVPYITDEMFPNLQSLAHECVLVSEADVQAAMSRLAWRNKLIVEPSGALAVAAALSMDPRERGKAVCLITGGSIDRDKLYELI